MCWQCILEKRANSKKFRSLQLCGHCGKPSDGRYVCGYCFASIREAVYPEYTHDTKLHGEYLTASRKMETCCEITGRSLLTLKKIGDKLSVDRIDSFKGYEENNMRIISLKLNIAKGARKEVPSDAIGKVLYFLERVTEDKLSRHP